MCGSGVRARGGPGQGGGGGTGGVVLGGRGALSLDGAAVRQRVKT